MPETDNELEPEEIAQLWQDRGGGILSDGQIDYLVCGGDELGLTNNAEKQRRRKVKTNYRSALPDFALLWQMSDKDLFETFAPLLESDADLESGLFELGILDEQQMEQFDPSGAIEDEDMAFAIRKGLERLMQVYVFFRGPEDFAVLAQRAINQAQAQIILRTQNSEGKMYELHLEEVTIEEKFEAAKDS